MFSQEKADAVCVALSEGKSLRAACVDAGASPVTILRWAKDNAAFSEQYARAREIGYKLLADEILEISDDSSLDMIPDKDGNLRPDAERVARSKLRVDSRKWMLSKMLPKIYGDKLEIGSDPDKPLKSVVRVELVAMSANSTN